MIWKRSVRLLHGCGGCVPGTNHGNRKTTRLRSLGLFPQKSSRTHDKSGGTQEARFTSQASDDRDSDFRIMPALGGPGRWSLAALTMLLDCSLARWLFTGALIDHWRANQAARVRPVASRITASSLNSARLSSPVMRPSCITSARSDIPRISSISLDTNKIATPSAARRSIRL